MKNAAPKRDGITQHYEEKLVKALHPYKLEACKIVLIFFKNLNHSSNGQTWFCLPSGLPFRITLYF